MDKLIVAGIICVILMVLGGCVITCVGTFNDTEITATIKDKEAVNKDGSYTYLIFTDKGVLENSDSLLRGKFDSSDFYNALEIGKTYKFTVIGFRIKFLSWYKNILEYEEVK